MTILRLDRLIIWSFIKGLKSPNLTIALSAFSNAKLMMPPSMTWLFFLTHNPTNETYSICVPDPYDKSRTLVFPLALYSMISYLPVRRPTIIEWDSGIYPHVNLTSEHLTWDP